MDITDRTIVYTTTHPSGSAVSWGAIIGGALGASAMALILFVLGTGLGLTSVSPWQREGVEADTFGMMAIGWIVFTSVVSSALGGYLAGRLRVKWSDVLLDEVYFRDTAHGFLAWALAALLTATVLASTMATVVGAGAKAGAAVAGGVADAAGGAASAGLAAVAGNIDAEGTFEYYADRLFRRDPNANPRPAPAPAPTVAPTPPQAQGGDADAEGGAAPQQPVVTQAAPAAAAPAQTNEDIGPALSEVTRIVTRSYREGELTQDDRTYLSQLVARHTGISAQDAERRVTEAYDTLTAELRELENDARAAADAARATSAMVSLWSFIALLAGAFAGSLAATWGGRQRDL